MLVMMAGISLEVSSINAFLRRNLIRKMKEDGKQILTTLSNGEIYENLQNDLEVSEECFWQQIIDEYTWLTTKAIRGNPLFFWNKYKKTRIAYFLFYFKFDSGVNYPGFVLQHLKKRCHMDTF